MKEILFNADFPDDPETGPREYVEKYGSCINEILEQVSSEELFFGMRITTEKHEDPGFNVVYHVRDPDDIYVTVRCWIEAFRKGRGEPDDYSDVNNKGPWNQCYDTAVELSIQLRGPKFLDGVPITYTNGDDYGVGNVLGPKEIREAILTLYYSKG